MTNKKTSVAIVATPGVTNQSNTHSLIGPEALIAQAIDRGVSVETMERLLAMRNQLKAEAAKEAFDNDMVLLQGEMPTIKKTKEVRTKMGKKAYSYAPIESIVEQTKTIIQKYGFSYIVKTEMIKDEKSKITGVKSTCSVKHKLGHSEESPMEVPLGNKTDIMSDSQVVAAASTFAKRYAFCNAFGIMTSDEDTDAADGAAPPKDKLVPDESLSRYEKALRAISLSKDTGYLIDSDGKIMAGKVYSEDEKKKLHTAIEKRVNELDNGAPQEFLCQGEGCTNPITKAEAEYSQKIFKKNLCRNCQKLNAKK